MSDITEQSKRAAVIIGRFQPPTLGHYAVIKAVKAFIRKHPELKLESVPLVVIVDGKETSKDKARNPLTADERIAFMQGSGKADGVKLLKATSAYDAFEVVRKAGYEPIAIAGGSDRVQTYISMLDKYFKTSDGDSIKHYSIELPRVMSEAAKAEKLDTTKALADILKYTDETIPVNMVSGSLARLAVKNNEPEKFAIIVGLTDKPKLAALMFDKIKAAMEKR